MEYSPRKLPEKVEGIIVRQKPGDKDDVLYVTQQSLLKGIRGTAVSIEVNGNVFNYAPINSKEYIRVSKTDIITVKYTVRELDHYIGITGNTLSKDAYKIAEEKLRKSRNDNGEWSDINDKYEYLKFIDNTRSVYKNKEYTKEYTAVVQENCPLMYLESGDRYITSSLMPIKDYDNSLHESIHKLDIYKLIEDLILREARDLGLDKARNDYTSNNGYYINRSRLEDSRIYGEKIFGDTERIRVAIKMSIQKDLETCLKVKEEIEELTIAGITKALNARIERNKRKAPRTSGDALSLLLKFKNSEMSKEDIVKEISDLT